METLVLKRNEVAQLLSLDECMNAVENAFRMHAEQKALAPKVLGFHTEHGGFHIKAGSLELGRNYFAAKLNANFPGNPKLYGLPSIQGIIVVCDALNGQLLALMDSIEITIIRTGAATGVAAKYLAREDAHVATICGCGNQGRISLKALLQVRKLEKAFAFDVDEVQAEAFVRDFSSQLKMIPVRADSLHSALRESLICVTCTPSRQPFIRAEDIIPGTFIAAVGADSEEKQELFSELISCNKTVVDLVEQSATIGEVHHAIRQGLFNISSIHGELGAIIAGLKPGRESDNEILIFDSTGTALQDVASAAIVYQKAIERNVGIKVDFAG